MSNIGAARAADGNELLRIRIHGGRGDLPPAVSYAACELQKYLTEMTGRTVYIDERRGPPVEEEEEEEEETVADDGGAIGIGLISMFRQPVRTEAAAEAGEQDDWEQDDRIHIDVSGGRGTIAGSNARSVLFAVYRYLHELGCRWVRPGKDGEYVPAVPDIASRRVQLTERAAYRYRAVCIEGAVSLEHVTDMIEWMPKVGFNSYFIQFRDAYVFFRRWYRHTNNPFFPASAPYEVEEARACVRAAEAEIAKRGLIYQAVGHGWTCEPFGVPGLSWDRWEGADRLDERTLQYFAMVGGERKLWGGVPLNTNACYSNPEVRRRMADDIVRYAAGHPHIDMLHVWLADGDNNQCECGECSRMLPSDWYVRLLNELGRELSGRGLPTKIACIIYLDLLWPPVRETFVNPERFVLVFAPIERSYRESFAIEDDGGAGLPEYVRNKLALPKSVSANLAFLKRWRQRFAGEGVDFDYHFMWAHHKDPGYMAIANVLHEDIRRLRQIGLSGYISCQVQRAFLPNGFGMTVMGRTLWNPGLSFDELADDYFRSAYGQEGDWCRSYLQQLSDLFFQLDLERANGAQRAGKGEVFRRIDALMRQAAAVLADSTHNAGGAARGDAGDARATARDGVRDTARGHVCHAASWQHLRLHARIWLPLTGALEALYGGDRGQAQSVWSDVRRQLWAEEAQYAAVFDVFNFARTFDELIGSGTAGN